LSEEAPEVPSTKQIWFTADSHFNHANIIKYCKRPYSSADEMDRDLVKRWNAKVKKDDIVWHLGDFCLGSKDKTKKIFKKLNGQINLVMGNHDRHSLSFYYSIGFNRVHDRPVVLKDFFVLSHAPLGWVSDSLPFANIFGHVHGSELYKTFTARSACVCVERWDYAPVLMDVLIAGMKKEEVDK